MSTWSVPVDDAPDWDSIPEQINCPLCEYDLRGISEPRCPECGFTFDWPDMLDPSRRWHPYLFEHHRERNFWSFWRTTLGTLLPRRFWRSLRPVQPSFPKRLILYWLLTCLTCVILLQGTLLCLGGAAVYKQLQDNVRGRWALAMGGMTEYTTEANQLVVRKITDPVVLQKYADEHLPDRIGWRLLLEVGARSLGFWAKAQLLLLPLLWPWLTFGSLMIFQWSMRRTKVRPIHVLRCCIYSAGTLVGVGVVGVVLLTGATLLRSGPASQLSLWGASVIGLLLLQMLYQLVIGFRLYLRFDHAVATVVSAHLILALLLFVSSITAWVLIS